MLQRLSLDAFLRACPKQLIAEHHKSERRIELVNGSRIYFGSADKAGALEGTNLAWAWVDEARLIAREAWQVIIGRVRDRSAQQAQVIVTTTPAMGWLSDFFDGSAGRLALHCSTAENAHNLAPGFLERLRGSYSARLAKSLIDGEFTVVAGQVYEEFDERTHAVPWVYDPALPLWLSWDFGVRCSSILFAQMTGDYPHRLADGRELPPRSVVIFDELQIDEKPTQWQIPLVKQKLGDRRPFAVVVDPAGKGRDQASGYASIDLIEDGLGRLNRYGQRLVRYETDFEERHIPNRIARVQGALKPIEGAPTLYVADGLLRGHPRGVVAALRGSVYPENRGRRASDRPVEDDKEHARDTLEYLVVAAQNEAGRGHFGGALRIQYGAA